MKKVLSFVFAIPAVISMCLSPAFGGGNNRDDKEQEVRDRFEWVVFGGEYHPWQLVAIGLDAAFGSGGEVSKEFAASEAKKLGLDFSAECAKQSKKSPIASGIM